jgi:hypothetical protein
MGPSRPGRGIRLRHPLTKLTPGEPHPRDFARPGAASPFGLEQGELRADFLPLDYFVAK